MEPAWAVILAVLAAALPGLLLVLILYSYSRRLWRQYFVPEAEPVPIDRRDAALKRSALMASLWRSSIPLRAFQWSEHPSHVITALEHGWPAFAFSYAASAMGAFAGPVHQMWEMCASCSSMKFCAPEISWTTSQQDCLQQVRLNPGLRSNKDGCVLPVQALQTALPLPGPLLGPCPYPQESYFELSILASGTELSSGHSSLAGSERVKLIAQTLTSDRYQRGQSLREVNDLEFCRKVNCQLKEDENQLTSQNLTSSENEQDAEAGQVGDDPMLQKPDQVDWDELLSVGLAGADAPPFRLLGFDPGSVGFLSADGHCYVNGVPYMAQGKEMVAAKGRPWGAVKTTVGCGFDPRVKRVYFTVNGELVHEATLAGADFSNPLYPTIASNYDVTVLVNLGQRTFEYVPANVARVANPCCRILQARPVRKSTSFFDDDISTDLFSMGRFDSHWLSDLEHRHGHSEADSDLFEIVLDAGHALKR